MSKDLGDYFKDVMAKLKTLQGDIARMEYNQTAPPENKKDMKSLRPVTRLRKNIQEAKEASANPEVTFIIDQLNDAFKG